MVNLMVVVTRYFGGIKLGVRGLIDAYGQAAESVIAQAERVLRMRSRRLVICLPYGIIGDIIRMLETYGTYDVPKWKYGVHAEVLAEIRLSAVPQVSVALQELQARKLIFSWSWFIS
jgi:putative IMPACT (imprinted ancient) family translation regulator